jgi:hypothetical protein
MLKKKLEFNFSPEKREKTMKQNSFFMIIMFKQTVYSEFFLLGKSRKSQKLVSESVQKCPE